MELPQMSIFIQVDKKTVFIYVYTGILMISKNDKQKMKSCLRNATVRAKASVQVYATLPLLQNSKIAIGGGKRTHGAGSGQSSDRNKFVVW